MDEKNKKNIEPFGLSSLVLGILSALIYFISILLPISAIVLGIIGLVKKKEKNGFAIAGLVLGILFTFQYINTNYLIPYLKEDLNHDNRNTINVQTYSEKLITKKAEKYGFSCLADECVYYDTSPGGIPTKWTFDLKEESFIQYFESRDSEYGNLLIGESKYFYQDNAVASAVIYESNEVKMLIYYDRNYTTGETHCDGDDCSFNASISRDTKDRFNEIINEK